MGRRNKTYSKDLHQQAYDQLTGMLAFGESKKEAMATGTAKNKIFSHATYKNYWKHIKYFLGYIKEKHPECTTLKNAKKYVNEWLQSRVDQGLSAWTVQLEAKALGKLYGISPDDEAYFDPPKRNRQDIKRSRGDRVRDQHFSKTNNDELIKFCRGTGLRRRELQELRGKDLVSREQIEAELSELEKIGRQGYALDDEECEQGARCVAAGVRDYTGKVVAGISVSGPLHRMEPEHIRRIIPQVQRTAQRLSQLLAYEE